MASRSRRSGSGSGCCRPSRGSARGSRSACSRCSRPDELARAVAAQDKAALSRASGVGPRLAGRIASELRERLVDLPLPGAMAGAALEAAPRVGAGPAADAVSALINLGYGRSEAHAAIAKAAATLGEQAPVDVLIRIGLQELASV